MVYNKLKIIFYLFMITLLVLPLVSSLHGGLSTVYGSSGFSYSSKKTSNGFYVNMYYNGVAIGFVEVSVERLFIYPREPYDIIIEFGIYTSTLKSILGGGNVDIHIILDYTFTINDEESVSGSKLIVHGDIIRLSLITDLNDFDKVAIDELYFTFVSYAGDKGISGVVDLLSEFNKYDVPRYFIKNLNYYALYTDFKLVDPGWANYYIYLLGRRVGILKISASYWFNYTPALRIYLDIYDRDLARMLNTTILLKAKADNPGDEIIVTANITPGEDFIIPKEAPELEAHEKLTITSISILFKISKLDIMLNVSRDIGTINIVRKEYEYSLPFNATLLDVKELGRGWVEADIAVEGKFDYGSLFIDYEPFDGYPSPEIIKAFVARNVEEHDLLIKVLMCFKDTGRIIGYVKLGELAPEKRVRVTDVPIDIILSTANMIRASDIPLNYTALEVNMSWYLELSKLLRWIRLGIGSDEEILKYSKEAAILSSLISNYRYLREYLVEIPISTQLDISDNMLINTTLWIDVDDPDRPVVIYIEPVYSEEFTPSPTSYRQMYNGSSWGIYVSMIGYKELTKNILINLGPAVFSTCGDGEGIETIQLKALRIYVVNADKVKVLKLKSMLYEADPPIDTPSLCTELIVEEAEEPWKKLVEFILNLILPTIFIVIALLAGIVVAIYRF